jgi:hypothetical protein
MFKFWLRRLNTEPTIRPPQFVAGMERIDWSKVKPSNGSAALDKCVAARLGGDR